MAVQHRDVVVGAGHMGLAIIRGLLSAPRGRELSVVEINPERRRQLDARFKLPTSATLDLRHGDAVVLAIPPQNFPQFVDAVRAQFRHDTPIISVMAGIRIATITEALGSEQVVRTIPNTPAEVARGMTVFYAPPQVTDETLRRSQEILSAIGSSMRVEDESMIDPATAICGGGPAFVSYFADAFCAFAEAEGFTPDQAVRLTTEVFHGTAQLIIASGRSPQALCREVMTPNGTTERGIARFEAGGLRPVILEALAASTARSRELSTQSVPIPTG